jgi:hypothetical protein
MAKTTIVSRISRCQPNLAPHFTFYRNNSRIFPALASVAGRYPDYRLQFARRG